MSNPFAKTSVNPKIQTELNNRSGKAGIEWAAKRFPWIVLTSLSSGCDGSAYTVLSSTSPNQLYGVNYRLLPIINSVDVKKQGELGTTRRATIKLTAFTDEQLIELQKCYFVPGMGARLEWGWSVDTAGNRAPVPLGNRDLTDAEAICQMNKLGTDFTNYNGIQGIVANFGYSLTTDNYWDCSVELIAASQAAGGSKVNTYYCNCPREYQANNDEGKSGKKNTENKSDLQTYLKDLQDDYNRTNQAYRNTFKKKANGANITISLLGFNAPQRTESGGEKGGFVEGLKNFVGASFTTETYISWGTLEAAVNALALPENASGKSMLGQVNSRNIELTWHPKLESTDPRVCVIPGTPYDFEIVKFKRGDRPPRAVHDNRVRLQDIMVNVIFLLSELRAVEQQEGTLVAFFTNVLKKINDVCGSLWEFEVVSSTETCMSDDPVKKPPTISIVDAKVYGAASALVVPSLPIAGSGPNQKASVLRDFTLNMKMTDAMKSQALYAGAPPQKAKTDSGGNCGSNVFREFGIGGAFYNRAVGKVDKPKDCDCEKVESNAKQLTYNDLFQKLADEVSDSTTQACRSAVMKAYADDVANKKDDHCNGVPLPFEFSFTIDGIGGLRFGQMVTSNRIPSQITDSFEWQITSVEHSITPNDWTTTVNTVCRYSKKK